MHVAVAINTRKIPCARQKVSTHSFIWTPVWIFCAGDFSGQPQWDLLPFQLERMRRTQAYTLFCFGQPGSPARASLCFCVRPPRPDASPSGWEQLSPQAFTNADPAIPSDSLVSSEMLLTDGGPNHVWFGDTSWGKYSTGVRSQRYKSVGVVNTIPIIQNLYNQIKTKQE